MNKYVVIDIDGTVSKVGDRLECLQREPKNWDEFYNRCDEDEPIEDVIRVLNSMFYADPTLTAIFCTGRREGVRAKTIAWLNDNLSHNVLLGSTLLMRPDGNFKHDTKVKPKALEALGISPGNTLVIFEDRDTMVKEWRRLGFTCFQVNEGDF